MVSTQVHVMYPVVIYHVNANTAIDIKNMLLADGLDMNKDFTWRYQKAQWDNFSHDAVVAEHVQFNFVHEHLAVFYSLKWT